MTARRVRIWLTVVAVLDGAAGSSQLVDLLPPAVTSWIQVIAALATLGTGVYLGGNAALPGDFGKVKTPSE